MSELPTHMRQRIQRENTPADERQKYDNIQKAVDFWYEARNPKLIPDMEEALLPLLQKAIDQSPHVNRFQDWEEAHRWKEYHEAGSVILAICYTHLYYGNFKAAAEWITFVEQKLPYSLRLYENRVTSSVRARLRYHEHCCRLYGAIISDKLGELKFSAERDEYDGPMLAEACRDMSRMRLQEGHFQALENYADAARSHDLRTPRGQWLIEHFYDAINPDHWEDHSENAWKEMDRAIGLWRRSKPESVTARIAEARFQFYRAIRGRGFSGEAAADFREWTEKGLELIMATPPECPGWYTTALALMTFNGKRFVDLADVFREGMRKYPDYQDSVCIVAWAMAVQSQQGREAAAGIVDHLAGTNPSQAAHVLCFLCQTRCLEPTAPWLDMELAETAIRACLDEWPDSISLRNELGCVSIHLGLHSVAKQAMNGLGDHWCRTVWSGHESLAKKLAHEPKTAAR